MSLSNRLLTSFVLSFVLVFFLFFNAGPARLLSRQLQSRFAEPNPTPTAVTGIIALGGSHDRIAEAVRLAAQFPKTKLIVTGASAEDEAYARTRVMDADRLLIEPYAKSTFENALFTRQLLNPIVGDKWLIVTSAIHMPRAIGAFREAGFSVVPWPVFDRPNSFQTAERAAWHEVFGLVEYWLLGRIDSLFPAPLS